MATTRVDLGGQAGQNAVNAAKAAKAKLAAANKTQQPAKPIANHRQMETAAGAVRGAHTVTKPDSKILQPADGAAQLQHTLPSATNPAADFHDVNTFREDVLRGKAKDLTERRAALEARKDAANPENLRELQTINAEARALAKAEQGLRKQVDQHLARIEGEFLALATKVSAPRNTVPTAVVGELFQHMAAESKPAALKMYKTHIQAKLLQLREDTNAHSTRETAAKIRFDSLTAERTKLDEVLSSASDPEAVQGLHSHEQRLDAALAQVAKDLKSIEADGARIAREQARTMKHIEEYGRINPLPVEAAAS